MNVRPSPFSRVPLALVSWAAIALCVVGCQSSVRVTPGTAENSHEHHALIYTKAAPGTGKVWYVHVNHPGDARENTPAPAPVSAPVAVPSPADQR